MSVLSKALRTTVTKLIEKPNEYNWYVPNKCNCGILARTLLGESEGSQRLVVMHFEKNIFFSPDLS